MPSQVEPPQPVGVVPAERAEPLGQIETLTALRGLCSLWVVFHHFAQLFALKMPDPLQAVAMVGFYGVEYFFIISGFVIAYVYQARFYRLSPREIARYLTVRLGRIYPLHAVMMGVFALLLLLGWLGRSSPEQALIAHHGLVYDGGHFLSGMLLVQAWGINDGVPSWNTVTWSISVEWLLYLVFPIMAFCIIRLRRPWVLLILVLLWDVGLAMLFHNHLPPLVRGALTFPLGVALCNLYRQYPNRGHRRWDLAGCLTLFYLMPFCMAMIFYHLHPQAFAFLLMGLGAVLVMSLVYCQGVLKSLMTHPKLVWLGDISYSIYLIHLPLILMAWHLNAHWLHITSTCVRTMYLLGGLAVILFLADWSYRRVERPARLAVKSWAVRHWN